MKSKTKLYFPYTYFDAKDSFACQRLLEDLLANGPAYTIVVHDYNAWREVEEDLLWGGMLEFINCDWEYRAV